MSPSGLGPDVPVATPLDSPSPQAVVMLPRVRGRLMRMMTLPTRRLSMESNTKPSSGSPVESNGQPPPTAETMDPAASADTSSETKAPFVTRIVGLPKLQRQLSMITLAHNHTERAQEEKVTAQRYERMMDRFQLRRVPVPRSTSSGPPRSVSRAATARKSSGGSFSSLANVTRRRSRGGNSVAAGSVASDGRAPDSRLSRSAGSFRPRSNSLPKSDPLSDLAAVMSDMFLAADIITRVRLFILLTAFSAKLVYMPYGVAYYAPNHSTNLVLDAIVDAVFLLNIPATCNTKTHTTRGQLLATRRAVWRHYRDHGFSTDLLAAIPFEFLQLTVGRLAIAHWVVGLFKMALLVACVYRHFHIFHAAWTKEVIGADKSLVAWMLYSRYSHLVRIGGIVVLIVIMAHYFACMWSWLHTEIDPEFFTSNDTFVVHMNSIYDSLQLLQGQGVVTKTPAQAAFGSVAVLLGSIALAVVFGHVAILVSNFSANSTSYQRKMERVFSVMGKLQLPHPIRERVHQYYEYLHAEYESLDGEIVKFAKDLSHTLELEVVLFKYMDVLMQVPHWRGCSPDFQKQLVLNLNVRVYLPDDFIMRRGEVGTECYLINRGTCKLCEYPTGNYEPPTTRTATDDEAPPTRRMRRSSTTVTGTTPRKQGASTAIVRPTGASRYSMYEPGQSEFEAVDMGPYSRISELSRGQAIGDMALLANYERSSDLRAVSYVEMCVIERETFQRILTRYPRDREVVVNSIVRHMMVTLEQQNVPCMLMDLVRQVAPEASVMEAIHYVSRAMSPTLDDPTIVFGVGEELAGRLRMVVEESHDDNDSQSDDEEGTHISTTEAPPSQLSATASSVQQSTVSNDSELLRTVLEIRDRLVRIEKRQDAFERSTSCTNANEDNTCHVCKRRAVASTGISASVRAPIKKLRRRHTAKSDDANLEDACPLEAGMSGAASADPQATPSPDSARLKRPLSSRNSRPGSQPVSARTSTEENADSRSPTLYADMLFMMRRTFGEEEMSNDVGRRNKLRRLRST